MMTHTSLCFRRQAGIQRYKRNKSHLPAQKWHEHQKVFRNSIKPSVNIGGRWNENVGFKIEDIIHWDWFSNGISRKLRDSPFYFPLWYNKSFNDGRVNYMRKISTYEISEQSTYDNIDSFMNFIIDMFNFSIYDGKEYIRRSFQ